MGCTNTYHGINCFIAFSQKTKHDKCRNPTLAKCEEETHTPKIGDLESSGTPKNLELDHRGQNTLHWGVPNIIGKASKCKCP